MALHVKLLDLNNEFLMGSHLPNRIAKSAIPEHLHLHFAKEGSFIQVGGLHADSPDDLVCMFASVAMSFNSSSYWSAGGAFVPKVNQDEPDGYRPTSIGLKQVETIGAQASLILITKQALALSSS